MADKIAHALYLKRPGQQNSRQHFILQAAAGARLFVSERIRSGGSEREWRACGEDGGSSARDTGDDSYDEASFD